MKNNNLIKTILSLCVAALIGFFILGMSENYLGAIVAVLIYGQALIVEAIRDLKR